MFSRLYQVGVNEVFPLKNQFIAKLVRFHFMEKITDIFGSIKVRGYRSILFHSGNSGIGFYSAHRSSHRKCSIGKVFLKISQYLPRSTCVEVSFLI